MVYSSTVFIFLFLPAVIFCYYVCPRKLLFMRNLILLAFSLGFYFYGEPKYILLMLVSIIINYTFAILIHGEQKKNKKGKALLWTSVVVNLLILIYFKYLSFFVESVNQVFRGDIAIPAIIMPIGISFFTFQAISYVLDVYRKTVPVQKNPANVALYISMFPQLIAGPIVRYETIAEELRYRETNCEKFAQGVIRFVYGFGKKIIIANAMGAVADQVFSAHVSSLSCGLAWLGAIAYSFQIFFDFSGYSDMAIGLGKIFGFTFLENFRFPYISKSITEFWRRWHISLGTWFRDYVYIPLGGNRVGFSRQILNLCIVWLLTGFWHGAAWNFVVWGLYFAVILVLEKTFLLTYLKRIWAPLSHVYALVLIIIGWVIFRSDNLAYAAGYCAKMFGLSSSAVRSGQAYYLLVNYRLEWISAILFSLPVGGFVSKIAGAQKDRAVFLFARLCGVFGLFILSILYLINSTFNPFIYFRF